jgi:hypothetical protein
MRKVLPVEHLLYEDEARRFQHLDLAELTERELWADRVLVDQELASLVFNRARPQWLDSEQSDQDWLAARAGRFRDELAGRKDRRGRDVA